MSAFPTLFVVAVVILLLILAVVAWLRSMRTMKQLRLICRQARSESSRSSPSRVNMSSTAQMTGEPKRRINSDLELQIPSPAYLGGYRFEHASQMEETLPVYAKETVAPPGYVEHFESVPSSM
jgi:hypothetical protein